MVVFTVSLLVGTRAWSFDMSSVLGVVGGGFVVSAIAEPLNNFINTVTFNKGVGVNTATKVVPIVSVGSGTKIGAAQVAGPKSAVDSTQAVAQLDVTFQDRLGVRVLVPIDSVNPLERFRRVQGVGVSAIVDFKL